MEGERQSLVFESNSPVSRHRGCKPFTRVRQLFRSLLMAADLSRGVAPLEAMKSGNRETRSPEDRVDTLDRSAADQRERTAGSVVQVANESMKVVLEPHLRRRRRDIGERSVDVEKVRPARIRRGKPCRTGWSGAGAAGTKRTVTALAAPNGSFHSVRLVCRWVAGAVNRRRVGGSNAFAASAADVRDGA